ncbi:hypothetical protein [Nitrosomonas communis]|uniref:Uncharacterized protein n=1 Tax=Nitrosomonas communis TaxID=44574 RepID=A0A1I4Q8T0_9PROT|nr:hypothetical protein [Nitrosomonas communis]SFM36469.1 hypothetical protein SAMN05421863_102534 [Nitrosomonas communis]
MEYIKNITKIRLTKFIDADKKTAKSYDFVNGKLVKETNGNFWNGSFETININYTELPDFINSMVSWEFLIQGVHHSLTEGNCPEDATRLKETFPFADSPGLLCIDSDSVHKQGIQSLEELNNALGKIDPSLNNIYKVMSTSASSNISVDGKEFNGLRGVHTFIPIDTTKNNKAILEILHARSIIAGFGYAKVTISGNIIICSLVDKALCTSNQPIYEGGAIINNDSIKQDRQVETFDGDMLSAASILPLTQEEIEIFQKKSEALRASVAEEAQKVREQFQKVHSARLIEKNYQLTTTNAAHIIDRAITDYELYGQISILLETGEEVTVQQILDNPVKYHNAECAHPLDRSIRGKSIIYSNQDKPVIHTFAHGGEVFFL